MKEKDLYPIIERWLRINMIGKSGAVEVKIVKGKSLPYNQIYEHQWNNLQLVHSKTKVLTYKISDESRGQKPFDLFFLSNAESYFCIVFYERGSKRFYLIEETSLRYYASGSKRKSINEVECKKITTYHFEL